MAQKAVAGVLQSLCGHSAGSGGIFSLPSLSFSTSSRFFMYGGTFFLHSSITVTGLKVHMGHCTSFTQLKVVKTPNSDSSA